jgi:hypothetical protein
MLVAILNHNLPTLTDNLVKWISKDPALTDLLVIDNGSNLEPPAKSTTHTLEENTFFGGGVNVILDYFLSTSEEYVYILNNDLLVHNNFLTKSLRAAKANNLAVYSPSVINASTDQCHWKQMLNQGTDIVREVKWVDWQAPLLRRDLVEHIVQFPNQLHYGWGLDFYSGIVGEELGVKTGVDDNNTITHLNSQTFKQNKINIGVNEFCQAAEGNMNDFFLNSKYKEKYLEYREYGANYTLH